MGFNIYRDISLNISDPPDLGDLLQRLLLPSLIWPPEEPET